MHGGVYATVSGHPETPCPYGSVKDDANDAALKQKADTFVKTAVATITGSKSWTKRSAIVIVTDENDFTGNTATDGWESAAGCCDSPITLPAGYQFQNSAGLPDGNVRAAAAPAGGLIPAIIITNKAASLRIASAGDAVQHLFSAARDDRAGVGPLPFGNASDCAQVTG